MLTVTLSLVRISWEGNVEGDRPEVDHRDRVEAGEDEEEARTNNSASLHSETENASLHWFSFFIFIHLPRRKMMARSYSWTVFRQNQMEMGKVTATRMMENTLTQCND